LLQRIAGVVTDVTVENKLFGLYFVSASFSAFSAFPRLVREEGDFFVMAGLVPY
jgi:hypothetical protein